MASRYMVLRFKLVAKCPVVSIADLSRVFVQATRSYLKPSRTDEESLTSGFMYSRTSNNGHCRGIQILSVIGGVR
jgi:hypothetical protein